MFMSRTATTCRAKVNLRTVWLAQKKATLNRLLSSYSDICRATYTYTKTECNYPFDALALPGI